MTADGFQEEAADADKYIHTFTGKRVNPLSPRPEQIDVQDIAHALSMKVRFTGHVSRYYSIAEHSVIMSWVAADRWSEEEALWALLHDAAEAYLPDISRPLKHADFFDGFGEVEETLQRTIYHALGHRWRRERVRDRVATLDTKILVNEIEELMPDGLDEWDLPPYGIDRVEIYGWHHKDAKERFLDEYRFLNNFA